MKGNNAIVTILVSTLEDGIYSLENTVALRRDEICYLIIHQTKNTIQIPKFLEREDINVIRSSTKGLSKSRNIALKNCNTKYALIADDDVEYISEGIDVLISIIKFDKPDFATFKIKTPNSEPEYKKYSQVSFKIGFEKRHFYSSIELLLNIESLRKNNIFFDERFGLGTPLKAHEEAMLIHDLVSSGLYGQYYPIYIVRHPFESSGKQKRSLNYNIFKNGAIAARTGNYGFRSRKPIARRLLDYCYYYYGVLYIKFNLPYFMVFIK